MRTIGSYEAKTHLPRLLDEVSGGEEITITKHGVPVARLVPPVGKESRSTREVIDELRALRRGVRLGDDLTIRGLIEEGRR